jgi:hypothetical protein
MRPKWSQPSSNRAPSTFDRSTLALKVRRQQYDSLIISSPISGNRSAPEGSAGSGLGARARRAATFARIVSTQAIPRGLTARALVPATLP